MKKHIVRADGELRHDPLCRRSINRKMEWPSVSSDPSGHHRAATATQELRRSQADREQAEALTGSFGWNLSSRELVCSDETLRILEDDRSVNRRSISFERIHPEGLSSAGLTTIGSELPMSYRRACRANTMEATRTFM